MVDGIKISIFDIYLGDFFWPTKDLRDIFSNIGVTFADRLSYEGETISVSLRRSLEIKRDFFSDSLVGLVSFSLCALIALIFCSSLISEIILEIACLR